MQPTKRLKTVNISTVTSNLPKAKFEYVVAERRKKHNKERKKMFKCEKDLQFWLTLWSSVCTRTRFMCALFPILPMFYIVISQRSLSVRCCAALFSFFMFVVVAVAVVVFRWSASVTVCCNCFSAILKLLSKKMPVICAICCSFWFWYSVCFICFLCLFFRCVAMRLFHLTILLLSFACALWCFTVRWSVFFLSLSLSPSCYDVAKSAWDTCAQLKWLQNVTKWAHLHIAV